MTKAKTIKGVAKRFKFTKTGKVKRARAFRSHIRTKKDSQRKRELRKATLVSKKDRKTIRRALPHY